MKKIMIQQKLEEIEYPVEELSLGDFDQVGEFTAKKKRDPGTELYKKHGCFFRPNYERGLLIYGLIRRFKIESYLEIGFGRGYSAFCAIKAMHDHGINGRVMTVEPSINEEFVKGLSQVFPQEWFKSLDVVKGTSDQYFEHIDANEPMRKFDLIYIDGDHRFEQVKRDWMNAKDRFNKFIIFDDYHFGDKKEKDMEVSRVVDEIEGYDRELIIMDRKIFTEDRQGYEVNYGQVLVKHPEFDVSEYLMDW